jgi:hypothetical protein
MQKEEYVNLIVSYFKDHSIMLGRSALQAFLNPELFNKNYLDELPEPQLIENMEIVLSEVRELFHRRRSYGAPRIPPYEKRMLTSRDVYPVLKRHFCKLPPFCRRKIGDIYG